MLLLCLPQTPLLFMGQEWACSSPFCFFTDHTPELGRLVTEGRRREFKAFSAFADAAALEGQSASAWDDVRIPFMAMLGMRFPATQFMVTGVLGPQSNAHGPNEFLDIDYAKRLTGAVAQVLAAHLQSGT